MATVCLGVKGSASRVFCFNDNAVTEMPVQHGCLQGCPGHGEEEPQCGDASREEDFVHRHQSNLPCLERIMSVRKGLSLLLLISLRRQPNESVVL